MKKSSPIIALILFASTPPAFGQDTVDTPARTAVIDTSVSASAETLFRTTVDTFAYTLINKFAGKSDTLSGVSGNIYHDTLVIGGAAVKTPADTAAAPADTLIYTSVTTPPPVDTPLNAPQAKESKKIFLLPAYTFHVVFLAASAALIAATLYFFLTRRRNDSRRFLTTTRLAVLDKLVQRGCRHIESNYPDPALTPETVCNSLVTGKAYLDALFMNELGINVQDFIIQVRVNAIKNLLAAPQAQPSPDINEICAECGFADRDEAERCFSAICGGVGIAEFARFSRMQNQRQNQNI